MGERLYLRTETRAILCADGAAVPHAPGELRPRGPLAAYVASVTFAREVFDREVDERVMPDGSVYLIVDFGDRPGAVVQGAAAHAWTLRFRGVLEHVGVRLRAGGIAAVLGVPAAELEGRTIALEELWGRGARELLERLAEDPLEARPARILDALEGRLRERDASVDRAARAAVHAIVRRRGAVRVRELAGELGIGARRLEQIFRRDVGLSPRTAARVARFRAAVDHASAHPEQAWAEVARACGYSDQAHLVREFRAIAGSTPGALARFGFFQSAAAPSG